MLSGFMPDNFINIIYEVSASVTHKSDSLKTCYFFKSSFPALGKKWCRMRLLLKNFNRWGFNWLFNYIINKKMFYTWNFPSDFLTRIGSEGVCGMMGIVLQREMSGCVITSDVDSDLFRNMLTAMYNQIGCTRRADEYNEKAERKNPADRKGGFHNGFF